MWVEKLDTNSLQKDYFSNKKQVLQFVLSLFVFYQHFRVFSIFKDVGIYLSMFLDTIMALTFVAVPLFFAISGALFYRNYNLSLTFKKWKSRIHSLCIPYLIWNTIWLLFAILGQDTTLGGYLGGIKTQLTLEAVISGIFLHKFFEPFWFMLQLIVLTALSPIIYTLVRNKVIGVFVIGLLIILNFIGVKAEGVLIRNQNMVIVYMIGAWIGIHHFEWFTKQWSKKQAVVCLLLYIVCCCIKESKLYPPQMELGYQISFILTSVSCIVFYIAFDFFAIKSCPKYMSDSFLVYAMHSFVGAALSKLVRLALPEGELYTVLTASFSFFATIFIICITGTILGRYTPRLKRVLCGR